MQQRTAQKTRLFSFINDEAPHSHRTAPLFYAPSPGADSLNFDCSQNWRRLNQLQVNNCQQPARYHMKATTGCPDSVLTLNLIIFNVWACKCASAFAFSAAEKGDFVKKSAKNLTFQGETE
ncbi:MAG TPA: hypothetical protein VIF60_18365 [Burkholderiaceae bacterium]